MNKNNSGWGKLPANQLNEIMNYLNVKDIVMLSAANKHLRETTEYKRTSLMRLLVCTGFVLEEFAREYSLLNRLDIMALGSYTGWVSYQIRHIGLIDYETGRILLPEDTNNISFSTTVLTDFANTFIGKNTKTYKLLVPYIKDAFEDNIFLNDEVTDKLRCEGIKDEKDFFEVFFKAGGFELERIVRGLYFEENCYKGDLATYRQMFQDSELRISLLKKSRNLEEPERENYINAYEKLNK